MKNLSKIINVIILIPIVFSSLLIGQNNTIPNEDNNTPQLLNGYEIDYSINSATPEITLRRMIGYVNVDDGDYFSFGTHITANHQDITFIIQNTGSSDLFISTPLTISGSNTDQFSIFSQPSSSIPPNGSTTFIIRFLPISAGIKNCSLHIGNNDSDENPFDLFFSGTGMNGAELDIQRPLGTSIESGGLDNIGNLVVGVPTYISYICDITNVTELGNVNASALINCNFTFEDSITLSNYPLGDYPILYTLLTISVNPIGSGPFSFDLSVESNDPDENPYIITIQGLGITDPGGPDMGVYGNGLLIVNGDMIPSIYDHTYLEYLERTYTILNEGTSTLELTGIPAVTIEGPYDYRFEVTAQPESTSIPPDSSTTFSVRLIASGGISDGLLRALISIPSNDIDESPYVFLVDPIQAEWKIDVVPPEMDLHRPAGTIIPDGGTDELGLYIPGTIPLTYLVSDSLGGLDLSVNTPTASNFNNVFGFLLTTPLPGSIEVGKSDTFDIQFDVGTGPFSFDMEIENNDPDENPYIITINGIGIGPEIDLQQPVDNSITDGGNINFGDQQKGSFSEKIFTIENTGTENITLTIPIEMLGVDSDQFSIQSQPSSVISAFSSTTFKIRFNPTSEGVKYAAIAIGNNDSNENPYDLILIGMGGPYPHKTISGLVRDGDDSGIENVSVAFNNGGPTVTTSSAGYYVASLGHGWSGTSTPNKEGLVFDPDSYTYSSLTTNQINQNYVGNPASVTISGFVRDGDNNEIEGVDVAFNNSGATVTTSSSGYYITSVSYGWSGVSTATKDGFTFTPENYTYPPLTNDLSDQDFKSLQVQLGVADIFSTVPERFTVMPAYPNPFNPSTTISYGIITDGRVTVQIYDIIGKLVSTLEDNHQTSGWHSVIWNGTNHRGEQVPAGIYISRITSGREIKTSKLMLLK